MSRSKFVHLKKEPTLYMSVRSVNKVILVGHLGRDAETKFTPSGSAVTRFSVATTRSWKDQQTNEWKDETNWANVVVWRQENVANYLLKGKQVYIEGRLQTRSYDDKDGRKIYTTDVVADEVILLGAANNSYPAADPASAAGNSDTKNPAAPTSSPNRGVNRMPQPATAGRNRAVTPPPPYEPDPFGPDSGITDDVPF